MAKGPNGRRLTQKQVAEIAGVSQSTVSLVLSGRTDTTSRISDATRKRVLELLQQTAYAADPAARVLAGGSNNLLGVFTYEYAFPTESFDFYVPLLTGVESAAEAVGADLLIFTSTAVQDGRRRLLAPGTRLRLADGCVLLGREMDTDELRELVELDYPFVAIGRRDGDERIPYVGVDYAAAVAALTQQALDLGHRGFLYLRLAYDAESTRDRLRGFTDVLADAGELIRSDVLVVDGGSAAVTAALASDATAILVEDPAQAIEVTAAFEARGTSVPRTRSVIALGEQARPQAGDRDITRLVAPRIELGARAVRLLWRLLNDDTVPESDRRVLLPCALEPGDSLAAAPR